jgi:hypothetical protein
MEKLQQAGAVAFAIAALVKMRKIVEWIKNALTWLGAKWTKLAPVVLPLVIEAEQMSLDGVITKAERKKWVMDGIALCEKRGLLKLNWISRMIVSAVVDKLAGDLPDTKISEEVRDIVAELKKLKQAANGSA